MIANVNVRIAAVISFALITTAADAGSIKRPTLGCSSPQDVETMAQISRGQDEKAMQNFVFSRVFQTRRCVRIEAGTRAELLDSFVSNEAFAAIAEVRVRGSADRVWVLGSTYVGD